MLGLNGSFVCRCLLLSALLACLPEGAGAQEPIEYHAALSPDSLGGMLERL